MNEPELDHFEAELRRTPPARPPEPFMARLRAAKTSLATVEPAATRGPVFRPAWPGVLRWLAPALAAGLAWFCLLPARWSPPTTVVHPPRPAVAGLHADQVKVDQEWGASFEVVARLPGGEPVRFRCQELRDQLVVTDQHSGVEIQENRPRLEVTPVRFETY